MNFLVKKEHKGSLLKILNNVIEQSTIYNETSAITNSKTFKRIEKESYPGASLREGILNAFAHCDYFIRSNIKIEFYDDKVRIVSPGGIYKATLNEIMNGIQTYRNPNLVNILNKLGYIENFGTGIPRIMNAYSKEDAKPEFIPTENFFTLVLPNITRFDPMNDPMNKYYDNTITDFDLIIFKVINENPGLNANKITDIIMKIDSTVTLDKVKNSLKRHLSDYCEFRDVKRNSGYYLK